MALKKLILGSAASLLVSGAVMSASPVLAQSSDPAADYAAAQARYKAELQAYNQKQQAYEAQRSEYNAKIQTYQQSLNTPPPPVADVVVVEDNTPDVVVVDPEPSTTVVVEDEPAGTVVVTDPPASDVVVVTDDFARRLFIRDVPPLIRLEDTPGVNDAFFNVPVVDAAGIPVGHFRRIEVKQPGDLVAVVTLNGSRRTISMLTEHVRLDPERRVVIADMTANDIARIPSGFPYG